MEENAKKIQREIAKDKIQIILSSIAVAVLIVMELYIMINFKSNFMAMAIGILLMIVGLFFLISALMDISLKQKDMEQEKYEEIYNAQKASYLVIKKSFDEMDQRLRNIEQNSSLPAEDIINAQKAVAKVTISRSKENTDALMNSNDELINQLVNIQAKIDSNNSQMIEKQQSLLKESNFDIQQKIIQLTSQISNIEGRIQNGVPVMAAQPMQMNVPPVMPAQPMETPVESMPVEENIPEEIPMEETPMEEVPADDLGLDLESAEVASTEDLDLGLEEAPAEDLGVDLDAVAEEVPVEDVGLDLDAVAEEAPAEDLGLDLDAVAEEAPAEDLGLDLDAVAEEAPAEDLVLDLDVVAEEVPAEEPVIEEPADEEPVLEELPAEEPIAEEPVMEEAPVEEAPTEEAPAEDIGVDLDALLEEIGETEDINVEPEPEPEAAAEAPAEVPDEPLVPDAPAAEEVVIPDVGVDLTDPNRVMSPEEIEKLFASI